LVRGGQKDYVVHIGLLIGSFFSITSRAEIIWNPDSDFGQYQSYGMFFDPTSMLVTRGGGAAWAKIGGSAAAMEFQTMGHKSQLVIQGTADASYRLVSDLSKGEILTKFETVDARVGLGYTVKLTDSWRGALIWTHESGHISDDIEDKSLIGPDVGNETFDFRVIHDIDRKWRLGGGLKPYMKSHPSMMYLWAEQFAEYFPYGASKDIHHFSPYITGGLVEGGVDHMDVTFNVQIGLAAADHFREGHTQGMRALIGYYNGLDPRMKMLQYKHYTQEFLYAGFAFEL